MMKQFDIDDQLANSCKKFGLGYGDPRLLAHIIERLQLLGASDDFAVIKEYLDDLSDPLFLINRSFLFIYCASKQPLDLDDVIHISKEYSKALSAFLSKVIENTKLKKQLLEFNLTMHCT